MVDRPSQLEPGPGPAVGPAQLLALQRTAGNRAVGQLLRGKPVVQRDPAGDTLVETDPRPKLPGGGSFGGTGVLFPNGGLKLELDASLFKVLGAKVGGGGEYDDSKGSRGGKGWGSVGIGDKKAKVEVMAGAKPGGKYIFYLKGKWKGTGGGGHVKAGLEDGKAAGQAAAEVKTRAGTVGGQVDLKPNDKGKPPTVMGSVGLTRKISPRFGGGSYTLFLTGALNLKNAPPNAVPLGGDRTPLGVRVPDSKNNPVPPMGNTVMFNFRLNLNLF